MIGKQQIADGTIDKTPDSSLNPTGHSLPGGYDSCVAPDPYEAPGSGRVRSEGNGNSAGCEATQASEQRVFHQRHLEGGTFEREEVIGRLVGRLRNRLRRKFPFADGEMVSDAVNESFMPYWANPQASDASLVMPEYYFLHASACNLSNLLRSEKRRKGREDVFGRRLSENSVELSSSPGNTLTEDPIQLLAEQEKWHERFKCLKSPLDREFVELWKDGELRVAAFAKVLGVTRLALKLQKAAVKRAKDRLTKQLQRARAKFGWII